MNGTQAGEAVGQPGIRVAAGQDREAIGEFLACLSARTSYLRFFTGGLSVGPATLAALTSGRDDTDVVIAASGGAVIGHAMAVYGAAGGGAVAADIGVVVADAWQGRGVGASLVRVLAERARRRGAGIMTMDVLAENRQVLSMIASHWPGAWHSRSGSWVTVHAHLPPPPPPAFPSPAGTADEFACSGAS